MECEVTVSRLMDFQFGILSQQDRKNTELHLQSCNKCLMGYFDIKSSVETSLRVPEYPSLAVKTKILAQARTILQQRNN